MSKLTQDELKRRLHYDPLTGDLKWLVSSAYKIKVGDVAGSKNSCGYILIGFNGKPYHAHRLAWFYMYGYFPENEIDHINMIRDDNRIINLREVSHQCNMRNRKTSSNNKSGVAGVSWDEKNNKWRSTISADGKGISIGRFALKTDAVKARWNAEVKYGFPNCNTTSTSYLYLKEKGVL